MFQQSQQTAHRVQSATAWLGALAGPALLTFGLTKIGGAQRDYVFIYLGLVAILAVFGGLWPALVGAAVSFLLVDFFFVPPVGTFTIANEQDVVNLLAFVIAAALVGFLASRRRQTLVEAHALTGQLRRANSELVRLNKEQAEAAQAELRLMRSQEQVRALQEADGLRRDLLANVSHELRTPLAAILTQSTTPLPNQDFAAPAAKRLRAIAVEARGLQALVDDMLDMNVIESGTLVLNLESTNLADAIEAAEERLHHVSPDRPIRWDHEHSHVDVLADWDRLGQIFDNLLANADRFGPPDTPIEISITQDEPGMASVRIRDHGPGIPPQHSQRIFERFVRLDMSHPSPSATSTGLGLAIVKGLVEAHAGSVILEPPGDDQGASFRFTLPLAP
jgi:K+-sensing histidine kinase KdpD